MFLVQLRALSFWTCTMFCGVAEWAYLGIQPADPRAGIFEQMTLLDEVEMSCSWQLITHPQNANLWPFSFLNNTTHIKVGGVTAHEAAPPAPNLCCLVEAERHRSYVDLQVQKVHIPADHSYVTWGCGE